MGNPARRNKRNVWEVATQTMGRGDVTTFHRQDELSRDVLAGSAPGETVLDPLAGSGTEGVDALRHALDFIGIELPSTYGETARERIRGDAPQLNICLSTP